ncbi:MAG: Holliday junction branch migration protein RuvA [Alphaproteobacteria bacterium]|nr:Holliday junction branch migration protein RuvA [Alphaproteobacteria bacterium]
MIGKLKGVIDTISTDSIILDVGGVGYLVYVSGNSMRALEEKQNISLIIETYVREELIHLYGFLTLEEKDCFLKLNSVSGVGTRLALTILSNLKPSEVVAAVSAQNKLAFKQISGVGPKLSERIILELKDKIFVASFIPHENKDNAMMQDAISALIALGISKIEAYSIVSKIMSEHDNVKIDEVIRLALKSRSV